MFTIYAQFQHLLLKRPAFPHCVFTVSSAVPLTQPSHLRKSQLRDQISQASVAILTDDTKVGGSSLLQVAPFWGTWTWSFLRKLGVHGPVSKPISRKQCSSQLLPCAPAWLSSAMIWKYKPNKLFSPHVVFGQFFFLITTTIKKKLGWASLFKLKFTAKHS